MRFPHLKKNIWGPLGQRGRSQKFRSLRQIFFYRLRRLASRPVYYRGAMMIARIICWCGEENFQSHCFYQTGLYSETLLSDSTSSIFICSRYLYTKRILKSVQYSSSAYFTNLSFLSFKRFLYLFSVSFSIAF